MTLEKGAFDLSWVKASEGGVNYDDKKYLSSAFKIWILLYYHQSIYLHISYSYPYICSEDWPIQYTVSYKL